MNLTPPSQVTFILSVLLAILALLVKYAGAAIPVVRAATASKRWCWPSSCFLPAFYFEVSDEAFESASSRSLRRAPFLVNEEGAL